MRKHLLSILWIWITFVFCPPELLAKTNQQYALNRAFSQTESGKKTLNNDGQYSLQQVLFHLESHYHVSFNYDDDAIRGISINEAFVFNGEEECEKALQRLLRSVDLTFKKIDEKKYLILPKKQKKQPENRVSNSLDSSHAKNHTMNGDGTSSKPIQLNDQLYAAELRLTGSVKNEMSQPMPGVNVLIKGTTVGTSTDAEGRYVINAGEDDILVFSFIGYKPVETAVGSRTIIDITLELDIQVFEEVVVVGYGTMKKSDLTGAVTNVDIEEMASLPNVSILQSLQGSVAGLNIGQVDAAGEDPTISIRGQSTLSSSAADNAPLIVVDGIIYRGSIIDLNTSDIATVDILKDASSAAIYGSQASNGVVIITTKKGKLIGKPVVAYSGSYTFQNPSNKLTPMHSDEYEDFYNDLYWDRGSRIGPDYLQHNNNFTFVPFLKTSDIAQGYQNGVDSDWHGMLTGNGSINTHNLSIRGMNETLSYFVSGGFADVKGYIKNDTYKRYNYRVNLDAKINEWFNVGVESFLTSSDYSGTSPDLTTIFTLQPWAPILDEDGEYLLTPEGSYLNPFLTIQQDDADKRLNLFGNFHVDIKLPFIPGLNYRLNYSQNYRTIHSDHFNKWGANYTGSGYKNAAIFYDWTLDNIISYQRSFNDSHNINLTLVYGVEERNSSYTNASAQNFVIDDLGYNRLEAGSPALNGVDTGKGKENSLYSMGRLSYNYKSKYLVTGTIRRDGFSGFGASNKIGVFPSVAVGWAVSEEPFFQDITNQLNYLKLRASYGTTGRRGSERYATQAVVSAQPTIVLSDGGSATIGQRITTLSNYNLAWETTTGLNVGLDFELLDSRISGNVEYFNNKTRDILYNVNLPKMTGFSSIKTNIGKVENHGVEFSLTGKVVNTSQLTWESSLVYSRVKNSIVSILGPTNDNDGDGQEDDLVSTRLFIGEPQSVIYDYEITGMWQLADDEAELIPDGFYPGTHKIADLNGDGAYSAGNDKKILGYVDPAYRFGFANTLTYKNFSLYVFINSIQGGKNYYMGDDSPQNTALWNNIAQLNYSNVPTGAWDYWMPENPNARYRRPDLDPNYSARVYNQRSFVRLQDISIAYTFQPGILEKLNLKSLKVFVTGKNLLTMTDWQGWDPETGTGFTYNGTPVMRNYGMGINVEF